MKKKILFLVFSLALFFANAQHEFITTWKTTNTGDSASNQITIPTFSSETYNYSVEWGDGSTELGIVGDVTHTYTNPGTYQVTITGVFPRIYFFGRGDKEKIIAVNQWGAITWSSFQAAFNGCRNLDVVANDVPDLSSVTNFDTAFANCNSLIGNYKFNDWDLSSATDLGLMFHSTILFNQDISNWDVSNVIAMHDMFSSATSFNQDIGTWNVSSAKDLNSMFEDATSFNGNIGAWNVSNVESMGDLFSSAISFNQNISNWNVSQARFMADMFKNATSFNQDIGSWNVSNVLTMPNMFAGATSFNQDIGDWNVGKVQFMRNMFNDASSFDQDLGRWNIKSITGINNMFTGVKLSTENYESLLNGWGSLSDINNGLIFDGGFSQYCGENFGRQQLINNHGWTITDGGDECSFVTTWKTDNPGSSDNNQITIPTAPNTIYDYNVDWGDGNNSIGVTGNITHTYASSGIYEVSITGTFPRIYFNMNNFALNEGDKDKIIFVNKWGTNKWTSMSDAFLGCTNLDVVATDIPDLSNVFIVDDMFNQCTVLVGNSTMADWDMSNVIISAGMFSGARSFNQPIGNWNMSNVNNMSAMFGSAIAFNQPIGDWDVSKVTKMESMFSNANTFNQALGNWDISSVTNMLFMFSSADEFNQDISTWDVSKVTTMRAMFSWCSSFNQDLSTWNVENVTTLDAMFRHASVFDQNIGNWNVSKVTNMDLMFEGAIQFNQNIGNWNIGLVESMVDMFKSAGLEKVNYDSTLIGWNGISLLQKGVQFDAGTSTYCSGEVAKLELIANHNWAITDSGKECAFLTTWKTDNPGASGDNQITIPTYPYASYDYTVEWGDGTSDTGVTSTLTHTYDNPGTFQIQISGDFPRIYFNNYSEGTPQDGDENKIVSIDQWGDIQWSSMRAAFAGCSNLDVMATDVPDLSNVTDLSAMFRFCPSLLGNSSFNQWNISGVTTISSLFDGAISFNQNIGNWNVSQVEHMGALFHEAQAFDQNIGNWDVSNVKYMDWVFLGAKIFNQNISAWDVSSAESMHATFGGTMLFNQDITSWNMSNVQRTDAMFSGAEAFNQDISVWDVSNVTTMNTMFYGTKVFNQDISSWDVSNVTDMNAMFDSAISFNQDISIWDVSQVTLMQVMFADAAVFDQDLGNWNVENVTSMSGMLGGATLSTKNYDKTLINWAAQNLQSNVDFFGGNSMYCDGEVARQQLINSFGWNIIDQGKDAHCNLDNDIDGVFDHLDDCLDTPEGDTVYENGCSIISTNNFTIESLGETCPDKDNGQIIIQSLAVHDFIATINGLEYSFNTYLTVNNLAPGTYEMCITNVDLAFEQCYALDLSESSSISGKLFEENGKTTINIAQGTAPYSVRVNGKKVLETSSTKFNIDAKEGDMIKIVTAKSCEGALLETMENVNLSRAYPNPTKGSFEIVLPISQNEVTIDVFTIDSSLLSSKVYSVIGGRVSLDITDFPIGIYIVKAHLEHPKTFKIIKQ